MKKLFILLLISIFLLSSCSYETEEDKDLRDMRCDTCGGTYHYLTTSNGLSTWYVYKCDNCEKEVWTKTWRGKE